MKHKICVFGCCIRYSLGSATHPSNVFGNSVLHILRVMMNGGVGARVRLERLQESSLTLRTSILPGIESIFVDDRAASYMAKVTYKDFLGFLECYRGTVNRDFSKDK